MAFKGSTDRPATEDDFKIGNYISGLCSFIVDCHTPMTIAIQGDWGSGKTSIMEMVRDTLAKEKRAIHCVWFNTWQYAQFNTGDSLSLSLIETIIKGLNTNEDEATKNMWNDLARIGTNVAKRAALAVVEPLIGGANTDDIKNALFESDSRIKDVNEIIKNLKERFGECVNAAVKKNKVDRILIFVDDLDRLPPIRAVELLEVLKIFLDCEKCVFMLAIDYNVVVSGVKSKYGADFNMDKGRSFFDKIIQVPFKMPVAQYDISSFVKNTFEEITADKCDDIDIKNYVSMINASIGSNPRSMKRLFNSYLLLLKVVDTATLENDSMGKKALFAILCMQQRFESLYNHVVMNRDSLDVINAEFFNNLAVSDNPGAVLNGESIITEDGEPEQIQAFIKCFNKTLSATDEGNVDDKMIDRLRVFLNCSSVTVAGPVEKPEKPRPAFIYKGEKYQSRGANKMNLSTLALRMILDYAKETDKTADEFMNMINERIPCYSNAMRKLSLTQIVNRSNPLLKKKDVQEHFFTSKNEIVKIGETELLALNGWGFEELTKLINLLGYGNRVTSNMK